MIKAPDYDWRCPRCSAVNAADTAICASCHHDVTFRSPSFWQQMKDRGVPAWRCVLAIACYATGFPLLIVGVALFMRVYFPFNGTGMLWSAAAVLAGGAPAGFGYVADPDR